MDTQSQKRNTRQARSTRTMASDIVSRAVRETLEELEKRAPAEYAKLNADPKKKDAIKKAAREAAEEQVKLSKVFAGQPPTDIAKGLLKHLPQERIDMIMGGLSISTFKMDVSKRSDGKHWVLRTRTGVSLEAARELTELPAIDWSKVMQYGSIVVEGVMLLMSAVGVSVSPGEKAIDKAVEETVTVIKSSSKFRAALDTFIDSWKHAGGSAWAKAKALFYLMKDSYSAGILWTVVKALCQNMSWYDWLETAAKVTAMIVAAFATDGAALIAEIALIILGAVDFAKKIANVIQLNNLQKSL